MNWLPWPVSKICVGALDTGKEVKKQLISLDSIVWNSWIKFHHNITFVSNVLDHDKFSVHPAIQVKLNIIILLGAYTKKHQTSYKRCKSHSSRDNAQSDQTVHSSLEKLSRYSKSTVLRTPQWQRTIPLNIRRCTKFVQSWGRKCQQIAYHPTKCTNFNSGLSNRQE